MAQIVPVISMVRKDIGQLVHNKSFIITAIVTILFNLILPNIMTFQVRNVSVATVSHDDSELSHRIVQDIVYTSDFILEGQYSSYDEALSSLKDGKIDCIIEIPENFERDFIHKAMGMKGVEPKIQVSANAINSTKVVAATQNILGSISTSLSNYARNRGVAVRNNSSFITTQNLYNPSSDYKLLMLPVMFIAITFIFNLATRLITNELQYGTIDQIHVSPMSRLAFMSSKLITCYLVSMINLLVSMSLLWMVYDFAPRGTFLLILLALSLYVLCCGAMALTLCNILSNASQMILFSSIVSLIAMMMSGYVTPLECVEEWLVPFSYILPTRYTIIILRNIALKGSDFMSLINNFMLLAALVATFFITSVLTCKKSRA